MINNRDAINADTADRVKLHDQRIAELENQVAAFASAQATAGELPLADPADTEGRNAVCERRCAEVLSDEHKDGSLWINRNGEIWAWVHGDWRMLRKSGLWSGMLLYSGESQMLHRGPYTEVDFARISRGGTTP